MPGHGSVPPPDRGHDPGRVVHRDSGMLSEAHDFSHLAGRPLPARISEYRPPVGAKVPVSDRGTRFAYDIGAATDMSGLVIEKMRHSEPGSTGSPASLSRRP